MDKKQKTALIGAGICGMVGLMAVGGWLLRPTPSAPVQTEEPDPLPPPEIAEEEAVVPPPAPPEPPAPSSPVSAPAPVAALPEEPAEEEVPEEESVPATPVVEPVQGEVVAAFSVEELAYNETMEDWRTHDGVDLAAELGTPVLSASAGKVVSVEHDPMMGTTVTIDHLNGVRTVYANLETKPAVSSGDEVSAGQIIGAVGKTAAAEAAQPPHLHFSVFRDGELVDPEGFLHPEETP